MRLRSLIRVNPSKSEVAYLSPSTDVTFAPMESIAEGLGGLDTSITKTIEEVRSGSYSYFADGDILLAKVTPCFENGKKAIAQGLANGVGFATSEVHVIRPDLRRLDCVYLKYLLCSEKFRAAGIASMTGSGGLRRVSENAIRDFQLPIIDLETQKTIAEFLDRETARIDELIEKKKQQITGLDEELRAFVSLAVTSGAYDRKTRPSPHQWLPSVPAQWTVTRLKFVCSRIVDCLHETPEHSESGEYPSIRTADVVRGRILIDSAKRVSEIEYAHRIQRLVPAAGDVVYTREGERFGLAALVPNNTKLCLGQRMMMFRTNARIRPGYLMWSLNGEFAYQYLKQSTAGATSPHLNIFDIRNVPIFLPIIEEQDKIVSEIDLRFRKHQMLSQMISASIERLRELRSSLVTEAVTRQIEVLDWQKRGKTGRRLDAINSVAGA